MSFSRSIIIATFLALSFMASAMNPERGDINFVIVSDLGDFGGGDQKPVAKTVGDFAASFQPTAILNLGDTFHYFGVESTEDPGWQSNFENIYTAPALHNMWYCALGNHDYEGNTQAEIDYTAKSRRWNLPARYYTKTFRSKGTTVEVIFLDTNPYLTRERTQPELYPDASLQDTAAQSRWLSEELANADADWVIVAAHHPVYSSRNDAVHQRADIQAHIEPILAARRPDIYLSGDVHCFEHFRSADGRTDYVTCTSGSNAYPVDAVPEALFADGHSGFASLTATKSAIEITMYDKEGNPLYNLRKEKFPDNIANQSTH